MPGVRRRQCQDKAILESPAVCPAAEVMKRVFLPKAASQGHESARTRAWTKIMTGSRAGEFTRSSNENNPERGH